MGIHTLLIHSQACGKTSKKSFILCQRLSEVGQASRWSYFNTFIFFKLSHNQEAALISNLRNKQVKQIQFEILKELCSGQIQAFAILSKMVYRTVWTKWEIESNGSKVCVLVYSNLFHKVGWFLCLSGSLFIKFTYYI